MKVLASWEINTFEIHVVEAGCRTVEFYRDICSNEGLANSAGFLFLV